jgi:hypothetical protein
MRVHNSKEKKMSDTIDPQITEIEKGPTEELRELEKSEEEKLVPGAEVPGAQNPASEEIKDEKNVNTE